MSLCCATSWRLQRTGDMFKYTSPWQVLVHSLSPHKRLSAARQQDDLSRLHVFTVRSLTPEPRPSPGPSPAWVMDSTPRRWELRPLSPSLQPSDLRTISAQRVHEDLYSESISVVGNQSVYVEGHSNSSADVVVEARQVSVSLDGSSSSDELFVSPCSSSAGSHSGFYSFVEDPFSTEAEQNEAWMVSPQRQSHLATLREENIFKLQTYTHHNRPGSLFPDETDAQYEINPRFGYKVVSKEEEKQLRKEIIQGQAPKKSLVVEKEFDSPADDTSRLIDGFSISYSHVNAKPKSSHAIDSESIDAEQINFDAARKQFLQMEQNKLDPIIRPRKIQVKTSPKLKQDAIIIMRREEQTFTPSVEDDVDGEVTDDLLSNHSRQSSSLEESDGLSRNASYGSLHGLAHEQIQPEHDAEQFSTEHETPIEREIRIAQEREENLRRSRGLQHSVSTGEMVKIETKRLNSPMPLTPSRIKEKGRMSFIFQEIQRNEDAIRQNGAQDGLRRERVNSFDILQSKSESNLVESKEEYVVTKAFEEYVGDRAKLDVVDYALQKQNYTTQDGSKAENRQSNTKQVQSYNEPYFSEARQEDTVHTIPVQAGNGKEEERWRIHNGQSMENGYESVVERSRDDSFSNDVFQLPHCPNKHLEDSDSSKQVQKQDRPRAASPQSPPWRDTLERTGLHTRGAAENIERDIEEALRRERELKEQREARGKLVYSPQTLVQHPDKMAAPQFYPQTNTVKVESLSSSSARPVRLSSVPLMSPQPWSASLQTRSFAMGRTNPWTASPTVPRTTPQTASSTVVLNTSQTASPTVPQTSPQTASPTVVLNTPQTASPTVPQTTPQTASSTVVLNALQTASSTVPQTTPQTTSPTVPQTTPQTASPTVVPTSPFPVRGLTQTLLQDFEERRGKLKLEESKYAGIQPIDSVNNEVVESTRVARHKNQRALQWEAGLFANQQDQ